MSKLGNSRSPGEDVGHQGARSRIFGRGTHSNVTVLVSRCDEGPRMAEACSGDALGFDILRAANVDAVGKVAGHPLRPRLVPRVEILESLTSVSAPI